MRKAWLVVALILTPLALAPRAQQGVPPFQKNPLAARISHTNPTNFRPSPRVHDGPGQLDYMALFTGTSVDTNLYFLHRGIIQPKSGIGGHFHNYCEEMFVIFDGEAEFTIDGRTSTLKGPAGAPTALGHWHAIYNPSDKPIQWMNINVSLFKNQYDAFNLGDGRVGAAIDPIPQFMSISLDSARLQVTNMGEGSRGEVKYRRVIGPNVFQGPWGYLDQYSLAPGAATAPSTETEVGGFFYVISGQGRALISGETADIKEGDAIPILLGDTKQFENTGTEPLQLMSVGVVNDMNRRNEILNAAGGARGFGAGGRGAAGAPGAGGRGAAGGRGQGGRGGAAPGRGQ